MVVVDAHAHLDRHRDAAVRGRDRRPDDRAEQLALPRQRRAAALAGHLGHRAAEVEVDVVGQVLGDHIRTAADDVAGRRRTAAAPGLLVGSNAIISIVSALRSTSARDVIISLTYKPAPTPAQPAEGRLVMPAIGARTTGGSTGRAASWGRASDTPTIVAQRSASPCVTVDPGPSGPAIGR